MKKKLLHIFLLAACFILLFPATAFAAEDAIPSITINVMLDSNGNATFNEVWDIRNVYDGTEYYKPLGTGIEVRDFMVWDESGNQYTTLPEWDTGRTREEKAGKCGILDTSDGYELCWGIGEYGNHTYTIQYTLLGLVKNYGDYAGFYHRFLSDLSSAPESVAVSIGYAGESLTADNARIWSYGFEGRDEISADGKLRAFTEESMGGGDYINLLCRFDTGMFNGAPAGGMTFEKLQKMADDENSNIGLVFFLAVLVSMVLLFVVVIFIYANRLKLADGTVVRMPATKTIAPDNTPPYGGSVPAAYAALKLIHMTPANEHLMGAYLIRMQQQEYIRMQEIEIQKGKKTKKTDAIAFKTRPTDELEAELYDLLSGYADHESILYSATLEKHADELHEIMDLWVQMVLAEGDSQLIQGEMAAADEKGKLCLTGSGFDAAIRMKGFQQHLKNLPDLEDGSDAPKEFWAKYLEFAALFGIGEKVVEGMQYIDDDYFNSFSGNYGYTGSSMMHFMVMTNSMSSSCSAGSSGTGGSASGSGGGGFSGGSGGGSR